MKFAHLTYRYLFNTGGGLFLRGEGLPVSNLSVSKNQIGFVILSDLNSDTVLSLD